MDRRQVGSLGEESEVKFYAITAAGRRQLARETGDWQRMSATIERFLGSIPDVPGEEVS